MPSAFHDATLSRSLFDGDAAAASERAAHSVPPGKRTRSERLLVRAAARSPDAAQPATVVQMRALSEDPDPFRGILPGPLVGATEAFADGGADASAAPQAVAARGVSGPGHALPHLGRIQAAFGDHDLSDVRAHTDGAAATASAQLGALGYATGRDIAFASASPDLHTVAHEAAHVVQQRAGVHLQGGLGRAGDSYEQHADAVADAVVRGESAAPLLGRASSSTSPGHAPDAPDAPVQRQTAGSTGSGTSLAAFDLGIELGDDAGAKTRKQAVTLTLVRSALIRLQAEVRSGSKTAAQAAEAAATRVAEVATALDALAAHQRELHPRGLGRVLRPGPHGEDPNLAPALADFDAIAADALQLVAAAGSASQARQLEAVFEGAAATAVKLGWQRPADVAAARTRKYQHEACPAGDDSPRACDLEASDRVEHVGQVVKQLDRISADFTAACRKQSATFQRALDRDQRLAEFIAGIAVEVLMMAITGPIVAPLLPAAKKASAGAGEAVARATGAAPMAAPDLTKFAGDVTRSLVRSASRAPAAASASTQLGDARRNTISALDLLEQRMRAQIERAQDSLRPLDDPQLLELEKRLRAFATSIIDQHVARFAQHYLQQVAPIGVDRPDAETLFTDDGWLRADKRAVGAAVRIQLPGGDRLALVDVLTDKNPGVTRAARTAAVAVDRATSAVDDDPITGAGYRTLQDGWARSPSVELHFRRWIDDPRMAAMAGAGADTVAAERVIGLPLSSLAPTAQ